MLAYSAFPLPLECAVSLLFVPHKTVLVLHPGKKRYTFPLLSVIKTSTFDGLSLLQNALRQISLELQNCKVEDSTVTILYPTENVSDNPRLHDLFRLISVEMRVGVSLHAGPDLPGHLWVAAPTNLCTRTWTSYTLSLFFPPRSTGLRHHVRRNPLGAFPSTQSSDQESCALCPEGRRSVLKSFAGCTREFQGSIGFEWP